jgi:endonuclease/exonuclease/phosphatase family metal-dependent hydrolase
VKKAAAVLAMIFCAIFYCRSTVLLNESFDYPDGSLVELSDGKWATHSGTTGEVNVESVRVNLDQNESEDVNALLGGQPYPAAGATNIFYAGFILRFTSLPGASGTYFAHFKDSSTGFRGKLWAFTDGATPGAFRLGISSMANSPVANPTDLTLNVGYQIVVRLVNGNSPVATFWIAPQNENSPGISSIDSASEFNVVSFAFRQSGGEGTLQIDNLKVATTFAEAISTNSISAPYIITQPENQAVAEGATATFSVLAAGTAPLNYQWQFNGTNLNGATGDSLTLTNVSSANAGSYRVIVSNAVDVVASDSATLTISVAPGLPALSILTYNTKGNGADDWSTNAAQVRAIGRVVQYLQPDIITFQEIPYAHTSEMTNFVNAFLPGYFLATNSVTDGAIRSVIASRFPIARSKSWLPHANLDSFGYTNANFTRDLFEAEINAPGFPKPVHVFTTHLKSSSGGYAEAAAKRAAEAAAITNFFATNFFVFYPDDPYFLSGDMNEANTNSSAIQRLVSTGAGLHLTNPTNPFTGSINTFSIQASLSSRIDYIFPGGILFSNIISGEIFRTDLLEPVPSNLQSDDSETASDHLPVLMTFSNPYNTPFSIIDVSRAGELLNLKWQSVAGRIYAVETSTNLIDWTVLASNLIAAGTNISFSTNIADSAGFFQIKRNP